MTFHRSRFVFSYEGETHPGCDTDAKALRIMQNHYAKNNEEISHFSDMDLYRRLVAQPGCTSVSICQIRFRGLIARGYTNVQVAYRSKFSDGRVETTKGPFYGERRCMTKSAIDLQEKEWIAGFCLDYNRYFSIGNPDRIFWETSEGRSVKEGAGPGFAVWGNSNMDYVPDGGHFRLVALAVSTTLTGGLRIGAFCESSRWGRIQDLVLYRNLLQKKRASVLPSAEERIRALFSEDFEEDVFRHVLGFL